MSDTNNQKSKNDIFVDRENAHQSGDFKFSPVLDRLLHENLSISSELERIFSVWKSEQERLQAAITPPVIGSDLQDMFAEINERITAASRAYETITAPLSAALSALETPFKKIAEGLYTTFQAASPFIEGMAKLKRWEDFLQDSGWLPHYTFPFGSIDDYGDDPTGFNKAICEHYENGWTHVKETMLTNIGRCQLDIESKEVFSEAIKAHEAGLYRSVPRLLFPEIERISRMDHHDNKMSGVASVPKLRQAAGGLTSDVITFYPYFSLEFFGRLIEHLYVTINEDNLKKFTDDPVPNRHATLHGHIIYNSSQSSLNMLFMADYIFQVISALRKVEQEEKNENMQKSA